MASNERKLRRPEFAGGSPVLLPDGQAWWFCEPTFDLSGDLPVWRFGSGITEDENSALSDMFSSAVENLAKAEDNAGRIRAITRLSFIMLYRNYRISPERYERILTAAPMPIGLWMRLERFVIELYGRMREATAEALR